jgi:FdhD/NarQ family
VLCLRQTSIEHICVLSAASLEPDKTQFSPSVLASLPDRLRQAQRVFANTGGLHAAGLFAGTGELMMIREDVGRHHAVDRVVGCGRVRPREKPGNRRTQSLGTRLRRPAQWKSYGRSTVSETRTSPRWPRRQAS